MRGECPGLWRARRCVDHDVRSPRPSGADAECGTENTSSFTFSFTLNRISPSPHSPPRINSRAEPLPAGHLRLLPGTHRSITKNDSSRRGLGSKHRSKLPSRNGYTTAARSHASRGRVGRRPPGLLRPPRDMEARASGSSAPMRGGGAAKISRQICGRSPRPRCAAARARRGCWPTARSAGQRRRGCAYQRAMHARARSRRA